MHICILLCSARDIRAWVSERACVEKGQGGIERRRYAQVVELVCLEVADGFREEACADEEDEVGHDDQEGRQGCLFDERPKEAEGKGQSVYAYMQTKKKRKEMRRKEKGTQLARLANA